MSLKSFVEQEVPVVVASGVAVVDLIEATFLLGGDCVPTTSISTSESEGEDEDNFSRAGELANTAATGEIVVVEAAVLVVFAVFAAPAAMDGED